MTHSQTILITLSPQATVSKQKCAGPSLNLANAGMEEDVDLRMDGTICGKYSVIQSTSLNCVGVSMATTPICCALMATVAVSLILSEKWTSFS